MFPNNQLSISVTNNTTKNKIWSAFGYNRGAQNNPGVFVSVSESSLEQATRQSASIPFKVKSIKIKTQSVEQLSQPVIIQIVDATGQLRQAQIVPMDYYDPDIKIPNLVKINNPGFAIDSRVDLQGIILAAERMNIVITIDEGSRFSSFMERMRNVFNNQNIKIRWALVPEL